MTSIGKLFDTYFKYYCSVITKTSLTICVQHNEIDIFHFDEKFGTPKVKINCFILLKYFP